METTANRLPCATCRRRKVRCSKTRPCTNCARTGIDCYYESNSSGDAGPVNADLMERLLHLQDSVQRLTTGPDNSAQTHRDDPVIKPVNGVRVAGSSEGQSDLENIIKMMEDSLQGLDCVNGREKQSSRTGKLCFRDAQARYIRETFWAGLYEEVSVNPSTGYSN
jgi:hypothetical protein